MVAPRADAIMSERYVVNELLAYIQTEMDFIPPARMINVKIKCLDFYSPAEISEARETLYNLLGMDVGIVAPIDKQSNLLDIFDRLRKTPSNKLPIFVSRDWRKLPQGREHPSTPRILAHVEAMLELLVGERPDNAEGGPARRGGTRPCGRTARRRPGATQARQLRTTPELMTPEAFHQAQYHLFDNDNEFNFARGSRPASGMGSFPYWPGHGYGHGHGNGHGNGYGHGLGHGHDPNAGGRINGGQRGGHHGGHRSGYSRYAFQ